MGVLKKLTDEYFRNITREEDLIDVTDLDVEIISFTDCNGKTHKHGYIVKDHDEDFENIIDDEYDEEYDEDAYNDYLDYEFEKTHTLKKLIERIIEKRGNECDLNDIDVSNIKKMNYMGVMGIKGLFENSDFNGDITGWNVSNVESMRHMFYCAKSFNQPIGNWDVSSVDDMNHMFFCAESFNQPIKGWSNKLYKVIDMKSMFCYATSFNQDISGWKSRKNGYPLDSNIFLHCPIKEEYKPKFT